MAPRISHVEWTVTDLERAVAFLSGLFGWHFQVFSSHYRLYTPAAGTCVGLMEAERVRPGHSPMVHVEVTDIHGYLRRAVDLGGRVAVEVTPISAYGWYAQVLDPDDNVLGLFQAGAP